MKYSNSCRICLGENAVYPLFSKVEDEDGGNVLRKFSKCLKENIEDIKGYPCNICGSCKNTLDIIYEFVNKYKESCRILSLVSIVKEEHDIDFESSYDNDVEHDIPQDEIEIYIDDIKEEPKIEYELNKETKSLERILKPLRKQLKITKVTGQKIKKSGRKKVAKKDKTNKIASSLLEGTCSWNGEKWCLLSDKTPHANRVHRICKKREFKVVKKEVPKEKKIPPPKLCDLCGDVFKTQDKLRKHKLKIHFKKPAKCEQCGRVCSSDRELNKHIKRRHLILEKNFVCATCGNRFAFKGELTNHCRKIHDRQTPKKKFTCKFCDKKYSCAKMVLIHERAVHTGERPAVCTVCNHSFTHEDYLKEHMRLHTGETPFKCPICGRGYAQRGNMKSHMIHNHKISDLDSVTLANLKPSYLKYLKPC